MRRKLLKKIVASACILSSLCLTGSSVYAATSETSTLLDTDVTVGTPKSNDCIVDVEVGSSFTITLPKKITLAGSDGIGTYDVTVKGDLAARQKVSVIPDETFTLTSTGKSDVVTTIEQTQKIFTYEDAAKVDANSQLVGTTATGTVNAGPLSKGTWSGTFNFNVDSYTYVDIEVEARDGSAIEVFAEAATIEGHEKIELVDALIATNSIAEIKSVDDVDALVELKSNNYDNIATVELTMNDVAQDGDNAVVLRNNETSNEWEFIGSEIVANNKITLDLSTSTPVPIVPDDSDDGVVEDIAYYTTNGAGTITGLTDAGKTLTTLNIPAELDGVANIAIEQKAFQSNTIATSVIIPDGVTKVGSRAFSDCTALESVVIPSSVTTVRPYAFNNCSSLKSVTIQEGATTIENNTFQNCTSLESIVIPSTVTSIENRAFEGCTKLQYISIPEGLTRIGDNAFYKCAGLVSIDIPDTVTYLGRCAFMNCTSLKSINIPAGVTTINSMTFSGCMALESVIIPSKVTLIDDRAFENCSSLTAITFSENLNKISNGALIGCTKLTEVTIPDGVTILGSGAFKNCTSLSEITIPSSVTTVTKDVFEATPWLANKQAENPLVIVGDGILIDGTTASGDVIIPEGVKSIGSSAFSEASGMPNMKLTSVSIPDGVTYIGMSAFNACSNITEVTIPSTVTVIAAGAFSSCTSLSTVNYTGTVEQWNAINIITNVFVTGDTYLTNATKVYEYTP